MGLLPSYYRKSEIAGFIGRPIRTVTSWVDQGLVIPEIEPSQGKGVERLYSYRNVIEFGMIEIMNNMGITLKEIGDVLKILRKGRWQALHFSEKRNIVDFRNFYEEDEWGRKKELICVVLRLMTRVENHYSYRVLHDFRIIDRVKYQELHSGVFDFEAGRIDNVEEDIKMLGQCVTTIIWLGSIKNSAIDYISI